MGLPGPKSADGLELAEIRGKFLPSGQKGRWARNGPFPFKNGLSWSTARKQKFGPNLTISQMGQKRPASDPEFSSQASRPRQDRCSRLEASNEGTIQRNERPRATPKPKLASIWSGQVQLADANPLVQDWKHPVKAPSEEN